MLFNDAFIDDIPGRPFASALEICRAVINALHDDEQYGEQSWRESEYDALREGYVLLETMIKGGLLPDFAPVVAPTGDIAVDCRAMVDFIHRVDGAVRAQANLQKHEEAQARMAQRLGVGFVYEFSQGDLDRIQTLLSELRKEISASTLYTDGHRERLLARLESSKPKPTRKWRILTNFGRYSGMPA